MLLAENVTSLADDRSTAGGLGLEATTCLQRVFSRAFPAYPIPCDVGDTKSMSMTKQQHYNNNDDITHRRGLRKIILHTYDDIMAYHSFRNSSCFVTDIRVGGGI